jgi:SanA protein
MLIASLSTLLFLFSFFLGCRFYVLHEAKGHILQMDEIKKIDLAIVFGAGLRRDGSSTNVLRDRVRTGAQLIQFGKVNKLLLSGYKAHAGYNEVDAMKETAFRLGIPETSIALDPLGRRTFITCQRAFESFHVRKAILISQRFHLPRAVYIARRIGIQAIGVSSDIQRYKKSSLVWWHLRELPACAIAILDCAIYRSKR